MRIADFDLYRELLKEKSGLTLGPDKSYLIDSRLGPIAKKWDFPSLDAMTNALRGMPDNELVNDIVEAMTTNETSFFRDNTPFELFKSFTLPLILEQNKAIRRLKIWSAAASSGQEPYSLAMIIKELQKTTMAGWTADILGTDISSEILEKAQNGVYSQFEVQRGLPIQMLMENFTQIDERWEIKDDIKKMVRYEIFNLLKDMSSLGKFDIIFCRNVLIYFDDDTKADVLRRMAKQLEPDGVLVLGGAETVLNLDTPFKLVPEKRGLYQIDKESGTQPSSFSTSQALA